MNYFRLPVILVVLASCGLRAQDDSEKNKAPPEEIPDFSNLDEYIYQPKSNLNFGMRYISGIKAKFSGNGYIGAPEALPSASAPNVDRTYHDGSAGVDTRSTTVDNGDGTTTGQPIPNDGKTNTWSYDSSTQITSDGYLQFNIYSAQTMDTGFHDKSGKGTLGWELSSARDMGNLSKHWSWRFFGGMSINDIQAAMSTTVTSNVTTVTDTYNLYGQTPPAAPATGTAVSTVNLTDSSGNQVYDSSGNAITVSVDDSVLISNAPLNRSVSSAVDSTSVTDHFKLHGGYAYFRAGPSLIYSPTERIHVNFTAGPALIYAGSSFSVNEVLEPPTGGEIVDTLASTTSRLLPGYFAEATLQFDVSERSGFYLGVFYQNAGSYVQSVTGTPSNANAGTFENAGTSAQTAGYYGNNGAIVGTYQTRVSFANQEGFHAGLAYKF